MDNVIATNSQLTTKEKKGVTGSTLKLIAIFTMLIDHTGATIIEQLLQTTHSNNYQLLSNVYITMRLIGRLGFPLFCFLLVEGFLHTRNKWKYACRLALFSLISEIPFDLAFYNKIVFQESQNVFFTLLIGLLVMIGFHYIYETGKDKKWLPVVSIVGGIELGYLLSKLFMFLFKFVTRIIELIQGGIPITGQVIDRAIIASHDYSKSSVNLKQIIIIIIFAILAFLVNTMLCKLNLQRVSVRLADVAVLFAGMMLADLLKTDYSGFGVLTIAVMYGLRKNRIKSMLGGCITLTIMTIGEFPAFLTLIPLAFYNGKRGLNLKYVFYLFYPVHLFILYWICFFMK